MKKFHWGHGITVVFIIFISLLITALVKSRQMDHNLVAKDYYAADIAYQTKYDKTVNARVGNQDFDVKWDENLNKYIVSFNKERKRIGDVTFYRPSDRRMDYQVKFDGNADLIIDRNIADGRWKVSVDWKEDDVPYFLEKDVFLTRS